MALPGICLIGCASLHALKKQVASDEALEDEQFEAELPKKIKTYRNSVAARGSMKRRQRKLKKINGGHICRDERMNRKQAPTNVFDGGCVDW